MEGASDVVKGIARNLSQQPWYQLLEHAVAIGVTLYGVNYLRKNGIKKVIGKLLTGALKTIPGAQNAVQKEIEKEADKALEGLFKNNPVPILRALPSVGFKREEVMDKLKKLAELDAKPEKGNVWGYVYSTDQKEDHEMLVQAYTMFMEKNALNPITFPSLRHFENDVVRMVSSILHGDTDVRGNMTSGGTESLLLAVKTYRDRARELFGITEPEMILPMTAHAAFNKAAHYFGVKIVQTPITHDYRADVSAMRNAINKNTILLVGSATQYPHGIVDPIVEIASLGKEYNLPVHVDACIGGFMLPWVKKLGYDVPDWDFLVTGVTSISIDVHKYGYGSKGSSVLLFKNNDFRKYQYFIYTGWPGGLFGSPTIQGTRGGGTMAGSWATLVSLGEEGYMKIAKGVMETSTYLQKEMANIPEIYILGKPHMSIIAFSSNVLNIFAISDVMEVKFGWKIEKQQKPDCIHMTIMPPHFKVKEKFIQDLKSSIKEVKENPKERYPTASMYGMVASIPAPELVEDFLGTFFGKVYS